MKNFLMGAAVVLLIGAVFYFGVYYNQNQLKQKVTPAITITPVLIVASPTVLVPSPTLAKENSYADTYFDFSFTYPSGWTVSTKMSKNRGCELAKKFMKNPTCTSEDLSTETLYIDSAEKDANEKNYGITIETATEGLGFACADNIEKNYSVTVKGKIYKFSACQDFKSKEEWGMGEMEVTGLKSEWKAILVNFSAKNAAMSEKILQILSSID